MKLRVTNPVTLDGVYYATGDIVDNPSGRLLSQGRLRRWETVPDEPPAPDLSMKKADLVALAEAAGFDPYGLTKAELVDLLNNN